MRRLRNACFRPCKKRKAASRPVLRGSSILVAGVFGNEVVLVFLLALACATVYFMVWLFSMDALATVRAPLSSVPFTFTWWPAWSLSASGLATGITCLSLSVTNTIFSPASRHFLAQSAFTCAPHFSSPTQPVHVPFFPAAD